MNDLALVIIGVVIIYQSYKLIKEQRTLRKKMDKLREDSNIEFSATEGTGITQVKKEYPELVDDWRQKVESLEPHSTSNHMNDPSDQQKYAFDKDEKMA